MFERLGRHFERVATWRQAVAEHRLVVSAIAAKDPVRARLRCMSTCSARTIASARRGR